MMRRGLGLIGLLMLFSVALAPASAQSGRQVWAFYLGFWVTGGWELQADTLMDYPAIGNYDSRDPGVGGLQIDQAKSAGLDAFLVSWYGPSEGNTTGVLNNLLDRAAERGFAIGGVIDAYSPQFNGNRDAVIAAINYLVYDRANHPAYLRYNGKPVIAFAFQGNLGFSSAQWQEIRNAIDPNRTTLWLAEGLRGCCLYGGAMDGMYAFNISWANGSSGRYSSERNAVLNAGGSLYVPMVHPGWDETRIAAKEGRPNPSAVKNRNNGQFLATSFNGAVASGADVIMIGTWNEYIENSHIEPSINYGTQSLDTLRPLIAAWETGAPAPAVAPVGGAVTNSAPPATSPTGLVLQPARRINVRPSAGTDGAPLGQIEQGQFFAITGESGDWYAIDYNGVQGWVSKQYVLVEQR